MGKKPKRTPNPPRVCIFCGGRLITGEHIWSDWLKEILPEEPNRLEGADSVFDQYGRLVHSPSKFLKGKGAVKSKKAEVVCKTCNERWMGNIVNTAKPYAMRLINAESFVLDEIGQRAMAKWIGLSALMANQVAKTQHKFPNQDIAHFYNHKEPPPHWFIGIGRFSGLRASSANQGSYVEWYENVATGEKSVGFIKHAMPRRWRFVYSRGC